MPIPATIGDNNPPDPIDTITAAYADTLAEVENWCDGELVENEGQMKAVDVLRKSMRTGRLELVAGEKFACAPLFDAHKAEKLRWKPTIEDFQRIEKALVAAVADFKTKLAEEKRAAERAAWKVADDARRNAEAMAADAGASDLEAQRDAADAKQAALDAEKTAQAQSKEKVGGMREITRYDIISHKDALSWIAKFDKPAAIAFIDDYVRRNHKTAVIDGVNVTIGQEAF